MNWKSVVGTISMAKAIRVLFFGRKDVGARCLEKLHKVENVSIQAVLTDDSNPQSGTTLFCKIHAIPIYSFEELEEKLEKLEVIADVGLSVLYWKKFKGAFLTKIPLGIVNFHPAPLPDYKGIGGYNLALLNNVNSWAVTAHYIDEKIDTGPIIDSIEFCIDAANETVGSLQHKSHDHVYTLFDRILESLSESRLLSVTPNNGGTYTSSKMLEEMKQVTINDSNDIIDLKIRAFFYPPYHGAKLLIGEKWYTLLDDEMLRKLDQTEGDSIFSKPQNEQ